MMWPFKFYCLVIDVNLQKAINKQSPLMGRGLLLTNYKPKL